MGLEAVLATLESRAAVTPVTPRYPQGVTAKSLSIKACTPVTPVTPKYDDAGSSAANDEANEVVIVFPRWRVLFPKLDPMEVVFTPEVTRAEVAAIYPGAVIEPLPDPPRRHPTEAEAAELRSLIERVLADTPNEWDWVHQIACTDPASALTCFRVLAADLPPIPVDPFPVLPTRRQCRNLASNSRCLAAARGELPHVANRRYEPVLYVGRRCEGFAAQPADPDQRSGRER